MDKKLFNNVQNAWQNPSNLQLGSLFIRKPVKNWWLSNWMSSWINQESKKHTIYKPKLWAYDLFVTASKWVRRNYCVLKEEVKRYRPELSWRSSIIDLNNRRVSSAANKSRLILLGNRNFLLPKRSLQLMTGVSRRAWWPLLSQRHLYFSGVEPGCRAASW